MRTRDVCAECFAMRWVAVARPARWAGEVVPPPPSTRVATSRYSPPGRTLRLQRTNARDEGRLPVERPGELLMGVGSAFTSGPSV